MDYNKHNRMLAIFKALANGNRLKILKLIQSASKGSLTVSNIANKMEIGQPTISDHLKLLRINKIVKAKQDGANMLYSIDDPFVTKVISSLD